jgi:hypothetical protein
MIEDSVTRLVEKIIEIVYPPTLRDEDKIRQEIESLLREAMREHGQMVLRNSVSGSPASYIAQGKHEAYTSAAEVLKVQPCCGECHARIAAAIEKLKEGKADGRV